MANAITARLDDIKERFERLSARDRVMVAGLGAGVLLLLLVGLAIWVQSSLGDLEQEIYDTRHALRDLERYHGRYVQNRARERELTRLISSQALELNSYVDKAATAAGVKVDESSATKSVEGRQYERRGLLIKLHKVNIAQLVALVTHLTDSPGQLVQITRLGINTRWNKHEDLDVELEISSYVKVNQQSRSKRRKRRTSG